MTVEEPPRLAEVLPDLANEVAELLEPENADLARTIPSLRFYGRCDCKPTCTVLLTAPPGSPTPYVLTLERDGRSVATLDIDPTGSAVTGIEIMDGRELFLSP